MTSTKASLSLILSLYEKDTTELFLNQYEGLKLLADWLGPFDVPPLRMKYIPEQLGGMERLASVLHVDWRIVLQHYLEQIEWKEEDDAHRSS